MSETNWLNPSPPPKKKMRVFFKTGFWVEFEVVDATEFHNMVNCIRSQGMLLTKTSYIPADVIGWIVMMDENGNPLGGVTAQPAVPMPTAPGSDRPQ